MRMLDFENDPYRINALEEMEIKKVVNSDHVTVTCSTENYSHLKVMAMFLEEEKAQRWKF